MANIPSYLSETLTDEQREAVLHYGSPLLIIAGPGSGKTEVISSRAAHFIRAGYAQPDNLLVTTFTNKAANEMRERDEKFPAETVHLVEFRDLRHPVLDLGCMAKRSARTNSATATSARAAARSSPRSASSGAGCCS